MTLMVWNRSNSRSILAWRRFVLRSDVAALGFGLNIDVEKATLEQHIKDGKVVTADTIEELPKR